MNRFFAIAMVVLAACNQGQRSAPGDDDDDDTGTGPGGTGPGGSGNGSDCSALHVVVRDFVWSGDQNKGSATAHPDFEHDPGSAGDAAYPGIVAAAIGSDAKPMLSASYAAAPITDGDPFITSAQSFAEWYTDTPGLSFRVETDLQLMPGTGGSDDFVYDSQFYFPVDGAGWGNETDGNGAPETGDDGQPHNFHFTSEAHATFQYNGGENFTFAGDDDVWVYVNGKLAIDLGGIHSAVTQTIDFDAQAQTLGITPGNTYQIDFFQAERHVTGSHFRVETSIACLTNVTIQ